MIFGILWFNKRQHDTKGGLTFLRLHGHYPFHIFDQSSADVKPPPSAFPKNKSIFFFFRDLTRIIDLHHGPCVLTIGPNRKFSSFFRNGIGGVVKEIIDHSFNMEGESIEPIKEIPTFVLSIECSPYSTP